MNKINKVLRSFLSHNRIATNKSLDGICGTKVVILETRTVH